VEDRLTDEEVIAQVSEFQLPFSDFNLDASVS
jgi:hypothetical protein